MLKVENLNMQILILMYAKTTSLKSFQVESTENHKIRIFKISKYVKESRLLKGLKMVCILQMKMKGN